VIRAAMWLLLVTTSALALADTHTELQRCASIDSDSRRLICFDQLAGRGDDAATATWREDRSRGIAILLDADRAVKGVEQSVRPQIVLRCEERSLSAALFVGMDVQEEHGGDDRTVILRFGQEKPFSERLVTSADGHSLLFDSPEMAASQLLLHDSLDFQFMPAGARPASVKFDTRGLEQAIGPLLDACGLKKADDGILEPQD